MGESLITSGYFIAEGFYRFNNQEMVKTSNIIISDSTLYAEIDQIPIGNNRKFTVELFNEESLIYYGNAFYNISSSSVTQINFDLYPVETDSNNNHLPIIRKIEVIPAEIYSGDIFKVKFDVFDPDQDSYTHRMGFTSSPSGDIQTFNLSEDRYFSEPETSGDFTLLLTVFENHLIGSPILMLRLNIISPSNQDRSRFPAS